MTTVSVLLLHLRTKKTDLELTKPVSIKFKM